MKISLPIPHQECGLNDKYDIPSASQKFLRKLLPYIHLDNYFNIIQYCSDKQKLETRFLKETGFLASQEFLTEQYCNIIRMDLRWQFWVGYIQE